MSYAQTLKQYHTRNRLTQPGQVVLFGGAFFAALPLEELGHFYGMEDVTVYNRSIPGLSVFDAEQALTDCVFAPAPAKVFLNLGEADVAAQLCESAVFTEKLEWLLYVIHSHLPKCELLLTSVLAPHAQAFDEALSCMARAHGCKFIDLSPAAGQADAPLKVYGMLKTFFRLRPITFCDAMCTSTLERCI